MTIAREREHAKRVLASQPVEEESETPEDRTEDEKVAQAGIQVILGGEEYFIKPLVIRESRVWRAGVARILKKLPQHVEVTSEDPEGFSNALEALLVTNSDEILDKFFEYAKDLDREFIEGVATEIEVSAAWKALAVVAFPLAGPLEEIMKRQ